MKKALEVMFILAGTAGVAVAGFSPVPEIDASAGVAAVTLLTGGILVLRGRRKAN